ncbi:MAG: polysaccharide biosynthesis C-terminal domain-containing protein [Pseudonocardia sp.]|nr:polysaccharide biosynthesis C-terminal domain-containing protein [Pseudonocardia sp.]
MMTYTALRNTPARIRQAAGSMLAQNTGWALVAEAVRLGAALGTFVVVTHLLPPSDYGVYVGTLGLMWFVLPFASCGASYLLLQRVAGEGIDLATAVARANGMVVGGGVVAVLVLAAARPVLLPQTSATVMVLLAIAELIFGGLHDVAMLACQALERLRLSVYLRLLQGVSRLIAAVALVVVVPSASLTQWAWLHLATAAFAALVAQVLLRVPGGRRLPFRMPRMLEVRSGLPFSVGFGADKLRESADSMLLLRIGTSADAGIFGAAIRLTGFVVTPLRALIASSNATFFRAGASSVAATRSVARRVTGLGAAYAVVASIVVAVGGPAAVSVLSAEYASAGDAVRILSVLPIAVAAEAFVATAMTAIGHQRVRVRSTLISTSLNILLNFALIPDYGWRGAVIASLTASAVNATILWSTLMVLAGRERRGSGSSTDRRRPWLRRASAPSHNDPGGSR